MPDTELPFESAESGEIESAPAEGVETASAADEPAEAVEPAAPLVADEVLLDAVDRARTALLETTPASTIGAPLGHQVEGEHVLSLLFACTMPGYPGWNWTVTISRIDDESEPSVLEVELMPGDGALLAPDWVPWSERLADYQASQEALHAAEMENDDETDDEESDDESFDDESDDLDDDSEDDDDLDDDSDVHDLHLDDIDGIDIDSADASYDEETDVDADLDLPAEEAAALDDSESLDSESVDSAPLDGEVAEADEPENESDDDRPEPPAVSGSGELAAKDEHDDEGDQPQS
ncbi:hypothetical protein GCM10009617_03420 [Leifsonia poae]|uniref:DUF3027 domain-containing protein n=1 Tax=Leifsonia poae TaxID=110933 RepID=A0A9W6H7D5_9MICO|nr:hypothetical protein GCM10017584_03420 [Leifsonia poae]